MIGVGNRLRGDDAAGLAVVELLRGKLPASVDLLEREGEPTSLIAAFDRGGTVWVVDAVSSGSAAGTVHRIDVTTGEVPARFFRTSTHHLGLGEAIELARAVGSFPDQLIVFGIEAAGFDLGHGLTPEVSRAVDQAATAILEEVLACTNTP